MSILWNPAEANVVEKVSLPVITTGTQNMGDGIYWLKAGTPLDTGITFFALFFHAFPGMLLLILMQLLIRSRATLQDLMLIM